MRAFVERARTRVARHVDLAFCNTALNPPRLLRMRSSAESLEHSQRMRGLSMVSAFYARDEFLGQKSAFFAQPRPISPTLRRRRALGREGEVLDLTWPSEFEPLWSRAQVEQRLSTLPPPPDGWRPGSYQSEVRELRLDRSGELGDKYLRSVRNRTNHARWFRHRQGPRPCLVLLHGYMGGSYAVEERIWPVHKLFAAGLDVVISILPFHGPRRSEARGLLPPAFPSSDPRFTIEGFRQLVFDQRALFDFLSRSGISKLGVMGMSLGGYSSALLATLEARLELAVLFIPLASIEDFAFRHGRLTGDEEQQRAQREALRTAQWVVSPFAREPLVPGPRVLVLAADSDLVTGRHHAERLAQHFATQVQFFSGGHLLHFGRARAFAAVDQLLVRTGFAEAR